MARATNTKIATRTPRGKAVAETAKRKPGRPLGSASAKPAKPAAKRQASPKIVARAPKMSKAELEVQVGKLERSIARLREKNKELKQVATDAQDRADMLETQQAAQPAAKPARKPRSAARSSPKSSVAAPQEDVEESSND